MHLRVAMIPLLPVIFILRLNKKMVHAVISVTIIAHYKNQVAVQFYVFIIK